MTAIPLPKGNNAAEMIRRLRAIDAEIFGTLYANAGIIGGDVVIQGDLIANDIYSENWVANGGTVPLSLPDGGASAGYALDSSSGIGQFSALYATGANITDLVASEITVGQLSTSQIANLAITTALLDADAVDATKIADLAVGNEHIQALSITATEIAANTITASQIFAGTITATEMTIASLDAITATMGDLSAGTISAADIYSSNWVSGGGTLPLSLPDASATTGFGLDGSLGVGQFAALYATGGEIGSLNIVTTLNLLPGAYIETDGFGDEVEWQSQMRLSDVGLQVRQDGNITYGADILRFGGVSWIDGSSGAPATTGSMMGIGIGAPFGDPSPIADPDVSDMGSSIFYVAGGGFFGGGDIDRHGWWITGGELSVKNALYPLGGIKGDVAIGFSAAGALIMELGSTVMTGDGTTGSPLLRMQVAGAAASPTYSFDGDNNTGMYRDGTDLLAFSTGGVRRMQLGPTALVLNTSTGTPYLKQATGTAALPTYAFQGDTNTGMYWAAANVIGMSTSGTARMEISGTKIKANNGSTGLVEIFPKTYLGAGTLQGTGHSINTTEQKFLERTIVCEYANQPVLVEVHVWFRLSMGSANYLWVRAGINGTAQGGQVPLQGSDVSGTSYVTCNTSVFLETTADGSGNVKVSAHAKLFSGTLGQGVSNITYKVSRR